MNTHSHPFIPALLALLLAGNSAAPGQDLPFVSGSTGADGALTIPSPLTGGRYMATAAWDALRARGVLFGGQTTAFSSRTMLYDGFEWSQVTPALSPPGRRDATMVWHAGLGKILLFGGTRTDTNAPLNDTWTWDGTTWEQLSPAASPSPRSLGAMAYDALRQEVVLFGGRVSGSTRVDETWIFNGTTWTQKASGAAPRPAVRDAAQMAFDAVRNRIVLFGGLSTSLSDTWLWDGTTWTDAAPAVHPPHVYAGTLVWDAARSECVLFSGYGSDYSTQTWTWNGTTWTLKSPAAFPAGRYQHAGFFDTVRNEVVIAGGTGSGTDSTDTWKWNGTGWTRGSAAILTYDMSEKANGVWNYSTINVPAGVKLTFLPNAANTPVTWLASGDVTIDGELNLDGTGSSQNMGGPGGPGGFTGGNGGIRFDQSSSYPGTPGHGPGGGAPGLAQSAAGADGTYTYGSPFVIPLVGGSGGGGGGSSATGNGMGGGGGGGALLIASSRDITMDGIISVRGGFGSGYGSGGAVRLVADRVIGIGRISGPASNRLRIEGFLRPLVTSPAGLGVAPSVSVPATSLSLQPWPSMRVASIAGQTVTNPAGGSLTSPDVLFSQTGPITITISATGLPDGTPVTCRVFSGGATITLPASGTVTLAGGTASFSTTVAAGLGSVQAFATYNTTP